MRNLPAQKYQVKLQGRDWKINRLKIANCWIQTSCKKKAITQSNTPKCPLKDYQVRTQPRIHSVTTLNYLSDYTDQLTAVNLDILGDRPSNNKHVPDLVKPKVHRQDMPNSDNNWICPRRDSRVKWVRSNPTTEFVTTSFDSLTSSLERTQEGVSMSKWFTLRSKIW